MVLWKTHHMTRVLIVDDVLDNVELLACALEDQGYEVFKALNGVEGLELAGSTNPDVIMLDVMMPGMDGIEVCRRLKADPDLRSIPVIMVSALETDLDLMRGLEAGAQDYIIKPYNVMVAMARVQIALARVMSATNWKLTADALAEREKRFQAVFNQTLQFMGLLDPKGVVLEVNRAVLKYIGIDREKIIGRLFWQSPWPGGSPAVREKLEEAVATAALGRTVDFVLQHHVTDGEALHLEFSIMPMPEESGHVPMLLVVAKDVTDRDKAQAGMVAAKETAEAANRAKGEFLSNVSHEIRTPMNAILGMTELTLDSELKPEQRENLEMVRSATDSLLSVVNDLLDFSKMEAGKFELEPVEFHLRAHIGNTLALLSRRAKAKGIELVHRVDPDVPDQLIGDPVRLRQIVVNLVGNAIKFTERGQVGVDVDLDGETHAEGTVGLHFRVTDTGIGIPADMREAIFAPFIQADGSSTRRYGGTGLGLAISTQLATLMGGRVWVESEVGHGSTFHFNAYLTQPHVRPDNEPVPDECLSGLHVLVVDQNGVTRRFLAEALTQWGMKPTLADSAQVALDHLERVRRAGTPFSLVLIDAKTQRMDGATLADRMKVDPELVGKVLVMVTCPDRQTSIRQMREGGTTACLHKPIRKFELKAAILVALGNRPRADHELSPSDPLAPRPAPQPLRVLLTEDDPFNQRVASLMLAKLGHVVTIADSGCEAIAAVGRQSFDVVLMELQMPEMDGFQATASIRSAETGTVRHVPIIALTGDATKEDRNRCLEGGMDGYVSKPLHQDQLRQAIEDCIFRSCQNVAAEPPVGALAGTNDLAAAAS
jgi:two-component system sensor histidine kinase/response regulator